MHKAIYPLSPSFAPPYLIVHDRHPPRGHAVQRRPRREELQVALLRVRHQREAVEDRLVADADAARNGADALDLDREAKSARGEQGEEEDDSQNGCMEAKKKLPNQ